MTPTELADLLVRFLNENVGLARTLSDEGIPVPPGQEFIGLVVDGVAFSLTVAYTA